MLFKSKYLIRLDDASPYSNLKKWDRFEDIFNRYNILPIIAAIPDNCDDSIKYSNFNKFYWQWLRSMKEKEWSIALHGYKHLFHKIERRKNFFPFYARSEFSGLDLDKQRIKIKKAISLFKKNDINPKIWVAPAHCFDETTLEAIRLESDIYIVSDGIAFNPYYENNFHFIPQQLWGFKNRFFGTWTICLHPDTMTFDEIDIFEKRIKLLFKKGKLASVDKLKLQKNRRTIFDNLFSSCFWIKYNLKFFIKSKINYNKAN